MKNILLLLILGLLACEEKEEEDPQKPGGWEILRSHARSVCGQLDGVESNGDVQPAAESVDECNDEPNAGLEPVDESNGREPVDESVHESGRDEPDGELRSPRKRNGYSWLEC